MEQYRLRVVSPPADHVQHHKVRDFFYAVSHFLVFLSSAMLLFSLVCWPTLRAEVAQAFGRTTRPLSRTTP